MTIRVFGDEILCLDEKQECFISCRNSSLIMDLEELLAKIDTYRHCDYILLYRKNNVLHVFLVEIKCVSLRDILRTIVDIGFSEKYRYCKMIGEYVVKGLYSVIRDNVLETRYYAVIVLRDVYGKHTLLKIHKWFASMGLRLCILVNGDNPLRCLKQS